ncbi:MAG: hypothetical protein HZB24_12820, partial [Desulfobacterales bacterium]|nr:hypothetical protein [Desulfobacterales bacterium]
LLPDGGKEHLDRIEALCRPILGWDRQRWRQETRAYLHQWQAVHGFAWQVQPLSPLDRIRQWLQRLLDYLVDRLPFLAERTIKIERSRS